MFMGSFIHLPLSAGEFVVEGFDCNKLFYR